eukprot:gene13702-19597_t
MMLSMESEPTEGNPQLVPALSDAFLDPGTPPTTYHTKSKAKDYLSLDVELHQRHKESMKMVFGRLWQLSFTLFLTYLVTLSIFPGVLAEDVSSQRLGDWYPLVLITVFLTALSMTVGPSLLPPIDAEMAENPNLKSNFNSNSNPTLSSSFLTALSMTVGPSLLPPIDAEMAENPNLKSNFNSNSNSNPTLSSSFLTALSMTVGPSLLPPSDAELAQNPNSNSNFNSIPDPVFQVPDCLVHDRGSQPSLPM